MNRMIYLGAFVVLLGSLSAFAVQAQLFSKRPSALSTQVQSSAYDPVVFRLVVNGQQLASRRVDTLNDVGSTPYKSRSQKNLEIEVSWIETLSKKVYRASVSVPAKALSPIGKDKDHVYLKLAIGKNGALQVGTSHPELGRLLEENRQSQITPEMDKTVALKTTCGKLVQQGDPAYGEMSSWLNSSAMRDANSKRKAALARDPNGRTQLTCD